VRWFDVNFRYADSYETASDSNSSVDPDCYLRSLATVPRRNHRARNSGKTVIDVRS
jgi:hypothetical protein